MDGSSESTGWVRRMRRTLRLHQPPTRETTGPMTRNATGSSPRGEAAELRTATSDDGELLRRAVFAAWRWRSPWDEDAYTAYAAAGEPDSYVDGFGSRPTDAGVIAVVGDGVRTESFLGAAWYRCFTEEAHRAAYVAEDVPEVVIAVEESTRGTGVGRLLLSRLIEVARQSGVKRLSLHVNRENIRAQRLYEQFGFAEVPLGDSRGAVMVLRVEDAPRATCDR
ncbi:GNAT family N-acetyltransferase [Brachybacterium alimentarium]|nr:GNAT family N-acetyltransferase [Brachybacterium alimentarium]